MPLVNRSIEPHYVSRVVVAPGVRNDLEFICNATLGRIIKQMSSLSKHAEDLFGDLHQELGFVFDRNSRLNDRIHRLMQKILQLNPVKETVSLQDMNMRKPFKSSFAKEQQILTLNSRPQAIVDSYSKSEPPPSLHKLDAYREDGKDSVKFYTDPGYFLELWCHEMVKNADNQLKKKHRNKRTRPVKEARAIRAPKNHLEDFKDRRHGPEFVGLSVEREKKVVDGNIPGQGQTYNRPNSLEASTPTHAEQRAIVGHGVPVSEYGLVFDSTLQMPGSLTDAGLGPVSQNTLPNRNAKPIELYPVDQIGDTVDSPANKSTSSKQTRRLGNYHTDDRYMSNDDRVQLGRDAVSPRPNMPPPAPPGSTGQRRGNLQAVRSMSIVNRNNLPPPPPAPVQQVARSESSVSKSGRQNYSPVSSGHQAPPAPVTVSPKGILNNSFDLPPPPTPPPPLSFEMIPSPPPMPSPPFGNLPAPPPPAMPPPLDLYVRADVKLASDWENNNDVATVDSASLASDTSSATVSSKLEEKPAVRDTRSDLLSAIRTGIQLRKVEERRLKTEQKQNSSSKGFDVQAIMEAAFELRRRALEENDSDKDEDDDAWSDDG